LDYDLAYRQLSDPNRQHSAQEFEELATEFQVALLDLEEAPDAHVDFMCRLLSDPMLVNRPGLEFLILSLYSDRDMLSETQLQRFFDCVKRTFALVAAENAAFALGDIVARASTPEQALQSLAVMTANATSPAGLAGVFLGLDILQRHRSPAAGTWQDAVEKVATSATERLEHLERTE